MYPWPAAFCYIGNERIKIIKARASEGEGLPGRIESVSGHGLLVGTQKGLLWIGELQPEGKRVMTAEDFINGRRLKVGNARFS
jgi:methionyl-tRNA formyltransferase